MSDFKDGEESYEGKLAPDDDGEDEGKLEPKVFDWMPAGCEALADGEYDAIIMGTGMYVYIPPYTSRLFLFLFYFLFLVYLFIFAFLKFEKLNKEKMNKIKTKKNEKKNVADIYSGPQA